MRNDQQDSMRQRRVIVAITGASGSIYGIRLLELLHPLPDVETHLILSRAGRLTLTAECDYTVAEIEALADVVHSVGNIGAPGRMNYTIVGDAVNTGNRLEQLSKELTLPDSEVSILMSGATGERLGDGFSPVSCGRQPVRGRQEPIEVFRLA